MGANGVLSREQMKNITGGDGGQTDFLPAPFNPGPNDVGCFGIPCNPYINCCSDGMRCDSAGYCGHP